MRVLYYCPEYYSVHGQSSHARGFFDALSKLPSVSEAFLYPDKQPVAKAKTTPPKRRWRPLPTTRRIMRFFRPERALTRILIQEIHDKKCDVLVIRTGRKLPILSAIKKACPGTSICLEVNSAYFDESFFGIPLRSLFQRWEVMRFRAADAITVVSSYLRTYLEARGVCSERILVNQNGVNAELRDVVKAGNLRQEYGIPPDSFVIGYIGGMESFRRIPEVVGYFAALVRCGNHDLYLLIIGDGQDMPAVRELIEGESESVRSRVKLTGWMPHSEIPVFLAAFDLAIFPFTNAYCSPLKLFEYLAAGIPTIGPDTDAVREVFTDGVHLRMVKQDGSDFVDAVLELKNDVQLRRSLSKTGQALVLEEYTWRKNAERVIAHVKSMSEGSQRQRLSVSNENSPG